jgi:hypothetical protein
VKIARSAPRPSFGLPELLVAIHTSRQSCCKAGKGRIFTPVRESSGESRFNWADDADGADAKLPTMRDLLPPSPPAEKTTARQQQARQNETPFRPKKADSVVVNQNL